MNLPALAAAVAAVALALALVWTTKRSKALRERLVTTERSLEATRERFLPILNVEEASAKAKAIAEKESANLQTTRLELEGSITELRSKYTAGLKRFEQLEVMTRRLEENLEAIDVGLYRPHFTYSDSDAYKRALISCRERQAALIKSGNATKCGTSWTVGGSAREGERMTKQTEKLILRAFNAESESAIANVSWNNVSVMQARMTKTFEMLNKHGTVLQVQLTQDYLSARLEELKLAFEEAEKKRIEREEQRRQRAEQREEERVQRELQREQEDAAKEETRFSKALLEAQRDLEKATELQREAMLERIRGLEAELSAAHERKERAVAMAQLTKVGHVYIISNIGAFGEGIVKIGMTRRIEPEERVKELGDASVPFPFDVHALIFSENAPELEAKLHERFWDRRINWANDRKEFFKISLEDVQKAIVDLGLKADVLTIPEAREYRETLAALKETLQMREVPVTARVAKFPLDPFTSVTPP